MRQHLTQHGYKKINYTDSEIIPVTIIELYPKNYLNLSYPKVNSLTRSKKHSTVLARAINKNKEIIKKIKKIYSTFVTDISSLSFILSTVHSILSPAFTSNILAIVAGTLVLTAFVLLAPLLIVDFCLNNTTITSNYIIRYTYICITQYIKLIIKSILIKVTFI